MKRFGLHGPIENFKIICYNGWSLGNLKNGGSQGGYIIYLVRENSVFSPTIWKSKKLRRESKVSWQQKHWSKSKPLRLVSGLQIY